MGAVFPLKCRVSVHPSLILWLSILVYLQPRLSLGFVLAASFHELGHILALNWMKKPPTGLTLHFMGASMDIPTLGYGQAIAAYAAGPAASLLLGLYRRIVPVTGTVSLCLGLFNLLPVCGLDGSGILENLLCLRFSQAAAQRIVRLISLLLCGMAVPAALFISSLHHLGLWLPMTAVLLLAKSADMVVRRG